MKPSQTDQPRNSPVAFLWKRSSDPAALFAICFLSVRLSAGQNEPLDFLAAVQVHHSPEQLSLLVGTARIDTQRASDAGVPLGLVDVSVQRQGRLSLLYRIPHRRRSNRYDRTPTVLGAHVLVYLGGVVESRTVGWTVEVVDRPRPLRGRCPRACGSTTRSRPSGSRRTRRPCPRRAVRAWRRR